MLNPDVDPHNGADGVFVIRIWMKLHKERTDPRTRHVAQTPNEYKVNFSLLQILIFTERQGAFDEETVQQTLQLWSHRTMYFICIFYLNLSALCIISSLRRVSKSYGFFLLLPSGLYIIIYINVYKTAVYTNVNGDMQWVTHRKQQKS